MADASERARAGSGLEERESREVKNATEGSSFFDGWEPLGPPPEVPPVEAQSWVLPPSPMRRGDSTLRTLRREMGTCLACFNKCAGPGVRFGKYCLRHIEMNQKRWEYLRQEAIARRAEWEKKAAKAGK